MGADLKFGLKLGKTIDDFFDRSTVTKAADKATIKVLGKFGAYCRQAAKNSIKRASAASDYSLPGQPPLSHQYGTIRYKDYIFFSFDFESKSVVIGATVLNGGRGQFVPGIIEYGGDEYLLMGPLGKQRLVLVTYQERPHMRPAFEATVKKMLNQLIENSIEPR